MAKPKPNSSYDCQLRKNDGKHPSKQPLFEKNTSMGTVSGRFCKNNCSEYKNNRCPRFRKL